MGMKIGELRDHARSVRKYDIIIPYHVLLAILAVVAFLGWGKHLF